MRRIIALVGILTLLFTTDVYCCTSAIISGKVTPDGRPLMWKHRDTGEENNRVDYIKGPKYNFIALINSPDMLPEAWCGTNEVGFSIMNTASYNLNYDNVPEDQMDREGIVMYDALGKCKTLADFEKLLNSYKKPIGVEGNFGVIDSYGGAAYYEVGNQGWKKVDVNDPLLAPQGYLVYSNHSYAGKIDDGMGYVRYTTADNIFKNHIGRAGEFTPKWIFQNLSRSFYNSLLGIDLVKDNDILQRGSGWFVDQDFIPRSSSSCSMVIKGVKTGENPLNTVMWTILGYPPVSVAVPTFVKAGENQPSFMTGKEKSNSLMCDMALALKRKVFAIKRGNGEKYLNFNLLYNPEGTGYMQQLKPVENTIFDMTEKFMQENNDKPYNKAAFDKLYSDIFTEIETAYKKF
jgi:hypothetical protein